MDQVCHMLCTIEAKVHSTGLLQHGYRTMSLADPSVQLEKHRLMHQHKLHLGMEHAPNIFYLN